MNNSSKLTTIMLILAIMVLLNAKINAEQVEVPEEELIQKSNYIIEANVNDQSSYWNDDHSLILTDFTVTVINQFTGDSLEAEINVTVLGGEIDDIGLFVTHQPHFKIGEKALLFLVKNSDMKLETLHGDQGKYELSGDIILKSGQSINSLLSKIKTMNLEDR